MCVSWSKSRQVSELRQKQKELLAQLSTSAESAPVTPPNSEQAKPADDSNTSELLRLRAEVNRLTRRKQELMAVSAENQRLKAQLASSSTNSKAPLPNGYIRKSAAQNRGYDTPQNTLETFLWALQTQNITNFLDTFTPEAADNMRKVIESSSASVEDFFRLTKAMPGLRIMSTERTADGTIRAQVEIAPGVNPESMRFRQIDGQWKLMGLP